jgi:hypothetical protein
MDITNTTEPKSDQQNYDDYIAGPKTVTITEVKKGSAEQPVELHLAEFPGRPYKPGKSMRRVLVTCWGPEASEYVGRRLTLYGDPTIKFGGQDVGGIRIAALSHITEQKSISLTVTRGKRTPFVVQPLGNPAPHVAALKAAASLAELKVAFDAAVAVGVGAYPDVQALKDARKAELTVAPDA